MANLKSNAFDSPVKSIFLKSSIGDYVLDIVQKNEECQYVRLEMQESVFEIFPLGSLVIRDTKDIVSIIQLNNIDIVEILFTSGFRRVCSLTSTSYINNAASDTEENFVSLNISNNLYKLSQKHSAAELLSQTGIIQDRVYTIDELATNLDTKLTELLGEIPGGYKGYITPADNYFCLKMLSAGNNHLNYSVTDNAFQYLNYLSSLAVGKPPADDETEEQGIVEREPRYLFWTTFDDYFYFKYFPVDIANETPEIIEKYETNNYRYAVYTGDVPFQTATNNKIYKKIYVFTSDPTNQFVSKNYFYIRKTPKFLDSVPAVLESIEDEQERELKVKLYTTKALSYHFQDDGEKYNIEAIASSGIVNGVTSGSDEVFYESDWGWISDFNTLSEHSKSSHSSGEFGTAQSYSKINYMGHTGYFSRVDNTEGWKNMFDMTEIHPDYPRNLVEATEDSEKIYYNVIQKNLADLYKEKEFAPNNLELLRKIERENFVLYALCCIQDEETFFARLIRYAQDPFTVAPTPQSVIDQIGGTNQKWRYKWEGLKLATPAGSTYWSALELWVGDPANSSKGNTANDTWAINLNERTGGTKFIPNAGGQNGYFPPGWYGPSSVGSFSYRPIGCYTATPEPAGATIAHIVKMYKSTAEKFATESGVTLDPSLRGKVIYYFFAENIVDGVC